jgi:hypothetical protein
LELSIVQGPFSVSPCQTLIHDSQLIRRCTTGARLKCWLYFPEDNCPFYRATIFSHYAAKNAPPADAQLRTLCLGDGEGAGDGETKPGPFFSLMFEVRAHTTANVSASTRLRPLH